MVRSRRSRHLAAAALTTGFALALLAGPASASTAQLVELSVAPCKYFPECASPAPPDTALVYLGGGEANRVSLASDAQRVRISDPAAQIDPGPGCFRVDDHVVSCAVPKVLVYVATGAGSDRVGSELGPASKLTVDGGTGNDTLVGGAGPDALLGGKGVDRLRGRGGNDRLFDSSSTEPLRADAQSPREGGSDVFFALPPTVARDRDSFDGGAGNDTVSYDGRRGNLRIDLAGVRGVSGARREGDSIRRVENAIGGGGTDRIAGDGRANRLLGDGELPGTIQGGNDRIDGRAGADVIEGGAGRNVLRGGQGNDTFTLGGSGRGERVACGAGTDSVSHSNGLDFLAPDCERPGFDFLDALLGGPLEVNSLLPLRKGLPPRILSGRLGCFLDFVCEVTAEVRVRGAGRKGGTAPPRGTLLGSHSFTIGAREVQGLDLRLSPEGLRHLRRHRALRVSVSLATQHSDGGPSSYLTLLRAP